jgi:molybdopterin-binding protein
MRFGARNQIKAKVTGVKRGNVMGHVTLQLLGTPQMASVMTLESIEDLGLKEGTEVLVLVKGVNVLLARED